MNGIYFYEGVDVKRFTDVIDNPDYQAPAAGALTKATRVIWFGERLNFFMPEIASSVQNQSVLFSGIRNSAGNGDKFNVSGLITMDKMMLVIVFAEMDCLGVLGFGQQKQDR